MSSSSISSQTTLQNIPWKDLEVGPFIDEGGYAEVYEGKWNGRQVAIKKLLLKKIPAYLAKDFEKETKIMAQCSQCPQIVKLFGVCTEAGQYAMIMEFVENGSLFGALQNEDLDLPWDPTRFKIAVDIGKGLSYLHDREILHRDLKSHNVLLGSNFNAKITDFGLSKLKFESKSHSKEDQNNPKKSVGTLRWQGPELMKINPTHTKASDVYAYGMILWEIASRKVPFGNAEDTVIMNSVEKGEQESIPEDCPQEYGKLIKRTWTKESDKRPSAQYIVLELEKLKPKGASKSWHFDPETKLGADVMGKEYVLIDASAKDVEKVNRFYSHHPVAGYEIASVKVVYNPTFNRSFESHMKKLQARQGNTFFDPKWSWNLTDKHVDWRQKIHEIFGEMAKPYTDPDYPSVKLLPLWHGASAGAIESICKVGYANPTSTDAGFFGRGLYGAHEAEYPYRVYCKGAFFLNWVAIYSAYPVVLGDDVKLEAKGNFENYDAHFIPVSPRNPSNLHEVNYDACKPFAKHAYTEVVVFESAACLPRYLVELQPTMIKVPKPLSPLKPKEPQPSATSKPIAPVISPIPSSPPKITAMALGKAAWEQYIGDIGVEPPLPADIDKILESPCPFWPGKKVHETHLLTLIPKTVNGKPLTLISLEELVKAPKQGNATQYKDFNVKYELGNTEIPSSYWVLMTRDVIKGSRSKTYEEQIQMVEEVAKKTKYLYEMPKAIEAAVSILMHYVKTKECIYTDDITGKQLTYTRCQERVNNNKWPIGIGGFAPSGLYVISDLHGWGGDNFGVGVSRRFPEIKHSLNLPTEIEKPLKAKVAASVKTEPKFPAIAFGKAAWEKYIGEVGEEPPLPPDIDKILQSPCPFWPGKKVQDTHLLTLVPKTVKGKPLTLISLEEFVKAPKEGKPTQYKYFDDHVKKEHGKSTIRSSYWVLMTKNVIEESFDRFYEKHQSMESMATKIGQPYTYPNAIEGAVSILMHYISTKKHLYTGYKIGKQNTYTRCEENVDNNMLPVVIGGFDSDGLHVSYDDCCGPEGSGVGASRKL